MLANERNIIGLLGYIGLQLEDIDGTDEQIMWGIWSLLESNKNLKTPIIIPTSISKNLKVIFDLLANTEELKKFKFVSEADLKAAQLKGLEYLEKCARQLDIKMYIKAYLNDCLTYNRLAKDEITSSLTSLTSTSENQNSHTVHQELARIQDLLDAKKALPVLRHIWENLGIQNVTEDEYRLYQIADYVISLLSEHLKCLNEYNKLNISEEDKEKALQEKRKQSEQTHQQRMKRYKASKPDNRIESTAAVIVRGYDWSTHLEAFNHYFLATIHYQAKEYKKALDHINQSLDLRLDMNATDFNVEQYLQDLLLSIKIRLALNKNVSVMRNINEALDEANYKLEEEKIYDANLIRIKILILQSIMQLRSDNGQDVELLQAQAHELVGDKGSNKLAYLSGVVKLTQEKQGLPAAIQACQAILKELESNSDQTSPLAQAQHIFWTIKLAKLYLKNSQLAHAENLIFINDKFIKDFVNDKNNAISLKKIAQKTLLLSLQLNYQLSLLKQMTNQDKINYLLLIKDRLQDFPGSVDNLNINFRQWIRLKGKVYRELAWLFSAERDFQKIIEYCTLTISIMEIKERSPLHYERARANFELKEYARVLEDYRAFEFSQTIEGLAPYNDLHMKFLQLIVSAHKKSNNLSAAKEVCEKILTHVKLPALTERVPGKLYDFIIDTAKDLADEKEIFSELDETTQKIEDAEINNFWQNPDLGPLYCLRAQLLDNVGLTRLAIYDYHAAVQTMVLDSKVKFTLFLYSIFDRLLLSPLVTPADCISYLEILLNKSQLVNDFDFVQKTPEWFLQLGNIHQNGQRHDAAIQAYGNGSQFLRKNSNKYIREQQSLYFSQQLALHRATSDTLKSMGKTTELEQYLEDACYDAESYQKKPAYALFAKLFKMDVLIMANRIEDAIAWGQVCLQSPMLLQSRITIHYCLADAYASRNKIADKKDILQKLLNYIPFDDANRNVRVEAHRRLGTFAQIEASDQHTEISHLQNLNSISSDKIEISELKARIELQISLDLYAEALNDIEFFEVKLSHLMLQESDNLNELAYCYYQRAVVFELLGESDEARSSYENAIAIAPESEYGSLSNRVLISRQPVRWLTP